MSSDPVRTQVGGAPPPPPPRSAVQLQAQLQRTRAAVKCSDQVLKARADCAALFTQQTAVEPARWRGFSSGERRRPSSRPCAKPGFQRRAELWPPQLGRRRRRRRRRRAGNRGSVQNQRRQRHPGGLSEQVNIPLHPPPVQRVFLFGQRLRAELPEASDG